jgi:transposase
VQALTGRFDEHHGELARMMLDQIDALTVDIDDLTARIEVLLTQIPIPQQGPHDHGPGGTPGPAEPGSLHVAPEGPDAGEPARAPTPRTAADLIAILDEIPGIGAHVAQVIIAEIGLDMSRFPTADHLVSWAKLCPRTIQSGARSSGGKTGKGDRYLRAVLGDAAAGAAKTDTFLGERYRRIVKRRGKLKALVAVARSILVIVWHLLSNPGQRYHDLGSDYFTKQVDRERLTRNHIRQLEALGYEVTLNAVA